MEKFIELVKTHLLSGLSEFKNSHAEIVSAAHHALEKTQKLEIYARLRS